MKKLYLLSIAIFLSMASNAQNFTFTPSQVLNVELITNQFSEANISFTPNQSGAITFGWQLISNDMPPGWSYSLCDYTNCYAGIPSEGTMTPISATEAYNGTTGFLKIMAGPSEVEGTASVVIRVYDVNNPVKSDTVKFNFNHVITLAVADQTTDDLTIYPNPANNEVVLRDIPSKIGQIQIYNVIGELVETIVPSSSSLVLDLTPYISGAYFVTFVNTDGIRRTKKLIVR